MNTLFNVTNTEVKITSQHDINELNKLCGYINKNSRPANRCFIMVRTNSVYCYTTQVYRCNNILKIVVYHSYWDITYTLKFTGQGFADGAKYDGFTYKCQAS